LKKLKYFLLTKTVGFYLNCLVFLNAKKAAKLAYQLFSEPRAGKLERDNLPEILKNSKMQSYVFEENEFQTYTWQGNENIILLVHGWESNSSRWARLLPHLEKTSSTIIAIDAPAHGLSSGKEFNVPKYAKAIENFVKIHNPNVLIGHSIGGTACIYYQFLNQNTNLNKMVLLGAPSDLKNLVQNYCNMLSLNTKLQANLAIVFEDKFKVKVDDFSAKKFAKSIATNALIVHDLDDKIVAFDEAEKIKTNWKNHLFVATNGFGHKLHDEELYQKITSFLLEA
jgi:predicted alpha/beta hydrolase family esterase